MSLLHWIVLKMKLLKGWLYFKLPFSLNIHVVSLELLSIHHLHSSALSPMATLCYFILILSCKTTQRVKAHRGQWVPFPMRNVSYNILGHPLQAYD